MPLRHPLHFPPRTISFLGLRTTGLRASSIGLMGICAAALFGTTTASAQDPAPSTAPPAPRKPAPSAGDTTEDVPLPKTPPPTDTAPTGSPADETPPVTPAPDDGTAPASGSEVVVPAEAASPEMPPEEAPPAPAEATSGSDSDVDDEATWLELHEDDEEEEREEKRRMPRYSAMVLVEGTAKYGAYSRVLHPDVDNIGDDDDPETDTSRAGQFGGQVTVGIMPGGSAFAMAARMKGGSYVGPEVPHGFLAAEMLFGANFARNAQGTSFTYILGGVGVEFLPGINEDMLSLSATGGTVVNGIDFGGSLSIAASDDVAVALIGMQIGWGRLF